MAGSARAKHGAWTRLASHRSGRWGCGLVLALALLCGGAGFFAPYDPLAARDRAPYHPPNLRFLDETGALHLVPFVHRTHAARDDGGRLRYEADPERRHPLRFFVRGDPYRLLGLVRVDLHLFGIGESGDPEAPRVLLLGSDFRGRCVFSRILNGGALTLGIGIAGVLVSFVIGLVVGGISGYLGGRVDAAIQRACETMMILPGLYVILAVRSAFPETTDWPSSRVTLAVILVLALVGWAGIARTIRGLVLSIRAREYVLAARAIGRGGPAILLRHVLPQTLPFAVVAATVAIPGMIFLEAALSLLGLGIQEPEPSWGNMLQDAMNVSHLRLHPWLLAPGAALCLAVAAFHLFGDGLRDALDPKARNAG